LLEKCILEAFGVHYYLHEKGMACPMTEIRKLNTVDAMRSCEAPCKSI
jgi:hypothetical protein